MEAFPFGSLWRDEWMEKGPFRDERASRDSSRRCKYELHSSILERYPMEGMPGLRKSA